MSSALFRINPINNREGAVVEVFVPKDAIESIEKHKAFNSDKYTYLIETGGNSFIVDKKTYDLIISSYVVVDMQVKRLPKNG